jgi:hypothetical protein
LHGGNSREEVGMREGQLERTITAAGNASNNS